MSIIERRILMLWVIASIFLFLYTFTQVDLSLTLSSLPFVAKVLLGFQYIGFFNRPVSSQMYLLLVLLFSSLYIFTVLRVGRKEISQKGLFKIIFAICILLTFSYNAFSYDIFNYIFDAKIVTHYHENPYIHKALDFPSDPMLSFMRWTHRVYPYGPVWLGLTVPLSFIGAGFFLPTFFLFKILAAVSYFCSVWFLYKIALIVKKEKALLATAIFALNPLVIVESLVSAHLDIVMTALMLIAVYYLFSKKNIKSYSFLILSIGIKYASGFLLPLFIFKKWMKSYFFEGAIILLFISIIAQAMRANLQPWYFVIIMPFIPLVHLKRPLIVSLLLSTAGLLYYLPPLFFGNWNKPVPEQLNLIVITSIFLIGGYLIYEIAVTVGLKKKKCIITL